MKIKKGDKVKIKDGEETYSKFDEMFVSLGFKNTKINSFKESYIDLTWTVVDVVKHTNKKIKLAFIKSEEKELLIGIKGLELIESEPTYQLTKYQIIAIAENCSLVKELFPECFEVTPTEVIKIIETYGKDKLITLIEAYERNSK